MNPTDDQSTACRASEMSHLAQAANVKPRTSPYGLHPDMGALTGALMGPAACLAESFLWEQTIRRRSVQSIFAVIASINVCQPSEIGLLHGNTKQVALI